MLPGKSTITIYKKNTPIVLNVLTDEQAGRLFKAILRYAETGENTEFTDDVLSAELYRLYVKDIDTIDSRYEKRCEMNRRNGMRGGRPSVTVNPKEKPKETERLPEKPNETERLPEKPNESKRKRKNPDTDTDTDNDTDTDTDTDTDNDIKENIKRKNQSVNNKTEKEDPDKDPDNVIPLTFEKIWNVYPVTDIRRKDGVCREYIHRIREGWEPEQLLKAAEHYSEYCKRKEIDPRYIVRPWNFYGDKKVFIDYIDELTEEDYEDGTRGSYQLRADFFG